MRRVHLTFTSELFEETHILELVTKDHGTAPWRKDRSLLVRQEHLNLYGLMTTNLE
jgi:hypothetical protein